jgi:hypothetical protein
VIVGRFDKNKIRTVEVRFFCDLMSIKLHERSRYSSVIFVAGFAASIAAHATMIDFTVLEGYATGNLDAQKSTGSAYEWDVDWNASTWKVASQTAQITSSTPNFQSARWTEAFSGTNITQSANLTFTRTAESLTAAKALFSLGINQLAVYGGKSASVSIRQMTANDTYQLFFYEALGTADQASSVDFTGASIGLTAGGVDTTDALTLDMTHSYNGGDSWTTTASLKNGITEVASLSKTWSAAGGPTGWSDADKFLTLSAANIADTTGVTVNFDHLWIRGIEPDPGYGAWAADRGLAGADADMTADFDGDGIDNLTEYFLGGNPVLGDAVQIRPFFKILNTSESNQVCLIHNERTDDADLTCTVLTRTNLLSGSWDAGALVLAGESTAMNSIKTVTNIIGTADSGFVRLQIDSALRRHVYVDPLGRFTQRTGRRLIRFRRFRPRLMRLFLAGRQSRAVQRSGSRADITTFHPL